MRHLVKRVAIWALAGLGLASANNVQAADLDYGKPGDPIHLVVGYQPYYSEAWSGAVINGLQLWKKYLPAGSTVEFHVGLQGSIVVNSMLAGKASLGYLGDMPAIVATTKRSVADLRIIANIGLGHDQCNVFFVRKDAPQFTDAKAAVTWLNGKTVASPKGSCADRFAQAVFQKTKTAPSAYLNQSIEVITSGFRVGKIDGAVLWEPTASRLVAEGLARRVASGYNFDEPDGAFLDARADLIKQRPDIIKAWLETELDAELFLANPANAVKVAELLKAQTTGFTQKELWQAEFGAYPASSGGGPVRLTVPFGFSQNALALIAKDTAFLHSIKSIDAEKLADDAVLPGYTTEILKTRGLAIPVGEIKAAPETAFR
ncbi:NitT/TauT family transport system substrate-binding protein [Methylovirgula ligni]|uniref:NitT/TauT family transport system substrate-binding protein n=1 Tax=Methylovirgula ligni TaxID=569860 RepID=A0A3D9YYH8_9HYPH|nr:ABC transporter substrate-binding protein [Methylovirgula ligni]REF85942.1 NitT/TauT family transport system substrate-binding protein [Methylovirgula ligni]